ncbi:MAG: response regulator [Candidatus Anammoxibacter sp.]
MEILIVEDEIASRMRLQKLMENIGDCESVENGEDALKVAMSENPPDLILLDIEMPGIDGYEVCKRLKANTQTKDIPVIFLTSHNEIESITRGFELGSVDYISKPYHKEEVQSRVRTHLLLKKIQEDLIAKNVILENQIKETQEKTEQLREKDIQLIEMDRIVGVGTLAAGIAHEINNPMSFVKSSANALRKSVNKMVVAVEFWDDKPVQESLQKEYKDFLEQINFEHLTGSMDSKFDRIKKGIDRIVKIVSNLKSFSMVSEEDTGEINVNQSLEEVVNVLLSKGFENVEFIKEFQDVSVIECVSSDIKQCFFNTIKNALDAIENNGIIRINSSYDEKQARVIVKIIDNGVGMTPEVLKQAFNPFFTTKQVGLGTGVGLSIIERIIKRYGGTIDISSKEGEGTTVTMAFPVVRK